MLWRDRPVSFLMKTSEVSLLTKVVAPIRLLLMQASVQLLQMLKLPVARDLMRGISEAAEKLS